MADEIKIRSIEPEEYPLLEDFLYDAIYFPEGAAAPPRKIVNQPELAISVKKRFRQQGIGSKLMHEHAIIDEILLRLEAEDL